MVQHAGAHILDTHVWTDEPTNIDEWQGPEWIPGFPLPAGAECWEYNITAEYTEMRDIPDYLDIIRDMHLPLTYPQAYTASEDPVGIIRNSALIDDGIWDTFVWGAHDDIYPGDPENPYLHVSGVKVPFQVRASYEGVRARARAKEDRVLDVLHRSRKM